MANGRLGAEIRNSEFRWLNCIKTLRCVPCSGPEHLGATPMITQHPEQIERFESFN